MYNLNSDKGRKIKLICMKMKLRIRVISPSQYLEPVGYLAGIEGIEPNGNVYEEVGFNDEMLVFKGFDNRTLDRFLKEFPKNKIEKIALKAILTPDNVRWSSLQLHDEIKKEHEALK